MTPLFSFMFVLFESSTIPCFAFVTPSVRLTHMLKEDNITNFFRLSQSNNAYDNEKDNNVNLIVARTRHTLLSVMAAVLNVPSETLTTPPMIEPDPPSTPAALHHRKLVDKLFAIGWKQSDGFETSQADIDYVDNMMDAQTASSKPSTYGEITELGARQLFHFMRMNTQISDGIQFIDMGSGAGKLVVQAYLEIPSLILAKGVELSSSRSKVANHVWHNLEAEAKKARTHIDISRSRTHEIMNASIELHHGDLFEINISAATHIYVASLCFTEEMLDKLGDKIISQAMSLQCVATLKVFPKKYESVLGEPQKAFVEMSWTKRRGHGCIVYFYFQKDTKK